VVEISLLPKHLRSFPLVKPGGFDFEAFDETEKVARAADTFDKK
jgi:hypothetical protein